jgi:site-specific DNA-methyltransferase (adenine-specific)
MTYQIHVGDCLDTLRAMPDNSVDSIVTDPPYGLSFMGKRWDYDVPSVEIWAECLRVLKPGGHLLAFAGTRTQHRMAVRIEDAGFEIRDMIAWVYGSGFPKSMDVSKAIDKGCGENRERQLRFTAWMRSTGITAKQISEATGTAMASHYLTSGSQPAIATADLFDRLRPHLPEVPEDIERLVAERTGIEWTAYKQRKVVGVTEMTDTRVASPARAYSAQGVSDVPRREVEITEAHTPAARQWQGWGTALKPALEPITVARKPLVGTVAANVLAHGTGALNVDGCRVAGERVTTSRNIALGSSSGGIFGAASTPGIFESHPEGRWPANLIHDGGDDVAGLLGDAARFFYCPKASKKDRGEGNAHPTVKPTDLMRYLCRLVTPPGGVVLDPFMGSGSTGKAAILEGFRFIGCELSPEYAAIAEGRIAAETCRD